MATNHLQNLIFQDEEKAREWLEGRVWRNGRVCPHCGAPEELTTRFNGKYISGIARHGPNLVVLLDLGTLFSDQSEQSFADVPRQLDSFRHAREIYRTDQERRQSFAEAKQTFELMAEVYGECGYEIVELPEVAPTARAQFILDKLHLRAASHSGLLKK